MKTIVEMQAITRELNIYLADDNKANCLLFKEALKGLSVLEILTIVHDGEQLLELLEKEGNVLTDVFFLELTMPRKNGFVSLGQIKHDKKLFNLPVIIFSTTNDQIKVKMVFQNDAHYYIRKSAKFFELKKLLNSWTKEILNCQYKKILC